MKNKIFTKTISFETERSPEYNGSVIIMVPNIPEESKMLHVEVTVTEIPDDNDTLIISSPKTEKPVEKPVEKPTKKENKVEEKVATEQEFEHKVFQNRTYRNYVQAVQRSRRR